jgi:ApbE superfamily uncharacterized protein (UPF0280 family)
MHQERTYRRRLLSPELKPFRAAILETDLHIQAEKILEAEAVASIITHRHTVEAYIESRPAFLTSLAPLSMEPLLPEIIREMMAAAQASGVGPMAAVAGAIAERVFWDLAPLSDQLIIENGGDIFLKMSHPVTIGIFAGESPLSMKIGLLINRPGSPFSICTSSGTVGHSLSFGKADAVCVTADKGALADAAATAIGNRVQTEKEIETALSFGKGISGVTGIAIVLNRAAGFWGNLELVRL